MIIGVPKEIKDNENRVAAIPATVQALASRGHTVLVQKGAGVGSGISDQSYESVGAKIVATARQVFKSAELILKVKEPLPPSIRCCVPDRSSSPISTWRRTRPLPTRSSRGRSSASPTRPSRRRTAVCRSWSR